MIGNLRIASGLGGSPSAELALGLGGWVLITPPIVVVIPSPTPVGGIPYPEEIIEKIKPADRDIFEIILAFILTEDQ